MIEIALYEPDIAPNTATILRLAACLGLTVRIIEPAGFAWSEASFRRAGLDYLDKAKVVRDASWAGFLDATSGRRRVLVSTKAAQPYCDFSFAPGDIILMDTFPSRPGPDHIGIISDTIGPSGLPLVINNWTNGTVTSEMDLLSFVPVLYRFRLPS